VALDGTGQAVGLLEFDGYFASDIYAYEKLAGLPNVPLTNVLVNGYSGARVATTARCRWTLKWPLRWRRGCRGNRL